MRGARLLAQPLQRRDDKPCGLLRVCLLRGRAGLAGQRVQNAVQPRDSGLIRRHRIGLVCVHEQAAQLHAARDLRVVPARSSGNGVALLVPQLHVTNSKDSLSSCAESRVPEFSTRVQLQKRVRQAAGVNAH